MYFQARRRDAETLEQVEVNGTTLVAAIGDIVRERSDAIVNAANSHLAHGGGVAGAISCAGGPEIDAVSRKYVKTHGSVKTGTVAVTGPGKIPVTYVIHAVGPIFRSLDRDSPKLYSATYNSLVAAHNRQLQSISIPAISSGIFGFPKDECAKIMISAGLDFISQHPDSTLKVIRYTNFDMPTASLFEKGLRAMKEGKFRLYQCTKFVPYHDPDFAAPQLGATHSTQPEVPEPELPQFRGSLSSAEPQPPQEEEEKEVPLEGSVMSLDQPGDIQLGGSMMSLDSEKPDDLAGARMMNLDAVDEVEPSDENPPSK